mgnify:CR=1 FL=1
MKIEAYREITDWSDTEYYVPNHTYLFDGKSNILAYAIEGTDEITVFKKPLKVSTTRRKFEKVKHTGLEILAGTFKLDFKPTQSDYPNWKVKSDSGKEYIVELISGNTIVIVLVMDIVVNVNIRQVLLKNNKTRKLFT